MKIYSIQPHNILSNKKSTPAFEGKNIPINNYNSKLLEHSLIIHNRGQKSLSTLQRILNSSLKITNKEIRPLLQDSSFLIALVPEKSSKLISDSMEKSPSILVKNSFRNNFLWDRMISELRNYVLSEPPEKIIRNIESLQSNPNSKVYKEELAQLKKHMLTKQASYDVYNAAHDKIITKVYNSKKEIADKFIKK